MLSCQRKQEPAFSHPLVKRTLPWKLETASFLFLTRRFFSPHRAFTMGFFLKQQMRQKKPKLVGHHEIQPSAMPGDIEMTLRAGAAQLPCPHPPAAPCHCRGRGGRTAPRLVGLPPLQPQPALLWGRCSARACACWGFKLGPSQAAPETAQPAPMGPTPWRVALQIRMLSAPNSFSIATRDSPPGGIHHFWPETRPSLPARARRWAGGEREVRSRSSPNHTTTAQGCWDAPHRGQEPSSSTAEGLGAGSHWRHHNWDAPAPASCPS